MVEELVARVNYDIVRSEKGARHFSWELKPLAKVQRAKFSQPAHGCRQLRYRFTWRLDEVALPEDKHYDGYSALGATVLRTSEDPLFAATSA